MIRSIKHDCVRWTSFMETPSPRNPNQFTAMVLQERDTPRPTHILIRGDFLKHGVKVSPEVSSPCCLPWKNRAALSPSRLDLARWLVCDKNPLTARVTVNRVWQRYFGRGLVKTVEDFGTQGEKPSHPELLDWLASEFMRQRWSQKALHRLIVTSATYRQSSKVTARTEGARSREHSAGPQSALASGSRDCSRHCADRVRTHSTPHRWPQCAAAPACGNNRSEPRQSHLGDGHRTGSLPPGHVHLLEADFAVSWNDCL